MVEEENQPRRKNKYKSITFSANRESLKSLCKGQLFHFKIKDKTCKGRKTVKFNKGQRTTKEDKS